MTEPRRIRVFISSPGDVRPERLIARRVVERLDREFGYHFRVEPVLWEREPLIATEHFQTMITPPRETDIVVVILWSRLGSLLPEKEFKGPITGKQVTGTEWEFEDAVKSYLERRLPDLMLYRKQAPVMASLEDDDALERQRAQKRLVEAFMKHWFVDEAAGTFKAASHVFSGPEQFEEMLEEHLRGLLRQRLDLSDEEIVRTGIRWHQGSPYRGLESFEMEHAPVFFGRTRARNALRELLVRQAAKGNAFVLVFGASGSGKSSLVKAGLLPDLSLPGMVARIALVRTAIMRPSDADGNPVAALAGSLLAPTALPELKEDPLLYERSRLVSLLAKAPEEAGQAIRQALSVAGKKAELTEHAEARVVVVVDQLEELFTLERLSQEERETFVSALAGLAQSGLAWVIATMRSDFFDRLAGLPSLVALSEGEGRYLLTPPTDAEIGQIIRQPAREAGIRFEVNEKTAIALDEELRQTASKDPQALPLLEFTLDELWKQRSDKGLLTYEAYERLGGMEGALGRRAEECFQSQPEDVQAALPSVLRSLVTVGQGEDARATARMVPMTTFAEGTPARTLVEAFLHPDARLLVAGSDDAAGETGARVRVAHEALLTHWPRAEQQITADRRDLQLIPTALNIDLCEPTL